MIKQVKELQAIQVRYKHMLEAHAHGAILTQSASQHQELQ